MTMNECLTVRPTETATPEPTADPMASARGSPVARARRAMPVPTAGAAQASAGPPRWVRAVRAWEQAAPVLGLEAARPLEARQREATPPELGATRAPGSTAGTPVQLMRAPRAEPQGNPEVVGPAEPPGTRGNLRARSMPIADPHSAVYPVNASRARPRTRFANSTANAEGEGTARMVPANRPAPAEAVVAPEPFAWVAIARPVQLRVANVSTIATALPQGKFA